MAAVRAAKADAQPQTKVDQVVKAGPYSEADFVKVADVVGVEQADAVPRAWIGTDLLPEGWTEAANADVEASATGSDDLPGEGASRQELEAYAVAHGWAESDVKAFTGTDAELRAALVEPKTGTQA